MRTNLVKKKDTKSPLNDGVLDMVIAFDTTGSMRAYINAVKLYVKELIPKLLKQNPNLKIGVVAFGDYFDMPRKDVFGKAYQVCELTNNEATLIEFINSVENTYGGDPDEFYELVIKKIVEETNWREGSIKAVLLIADASPHEVGYNYGDKVINNQIDWREEAKKAAEKGIKFDTLTIGATWYKELSSITKGVSVPFSTSSKTSQLVEAAALARGGEKTRGLYKTTMDSFEASGDIEMTAVYAAYSKEIIY